MAEQLEALVAGRLEQIQQGQSFVLDLRRAQGDVMRMQCTPLPDGGRMLSYMEVTDIVRQADQLRVLRDALENVRDGVLLLNSDLKATFMNRKVRKFWELTDQEAASQPFYGTLITRATRALEPNLSATQLAGFATKRGAEVRAGDHARELQTPDVTGNQPLARKDCRRAHPQAHRRATSKSSRSAIQHCRGRG